MFYIILNIFLGHFMWFWCKYDICLNYSQSRWINIIINKQERLLGYYWQKKSHILDWTFTKEDLHISWTSILFRYSIKKKSCNICSRITHKYYCIFLWIATFISIMQIYSVVNKYCEKYIWGVFLAGLFISPNPIVAHP